MLLRLDNRGEGLAELLPTQVVALSVIVPLRQVMRVGRVIGLGGRVAAHVVRRATSDAINPDDTDVAGGDFAFAVRPGFHLPDRILRIERAAVVGV